MKCLLHFSKPGAAATLLALCVIVLRLSAGPLLFTQSSAAPTLRYYAVINDRAWESERWTGDDRPFAQVRLSIDRLFNAKVDAQPFVSQYQALAKVNPRDALDQFRWAYAVLKQGDIPHPVHRDTSEITIALADAVQPHTYNYTRMRLLFQYAGPKELGLFERLLARDPSDDRVKSIYAFILSETKLKKDDDKAVSIEEAIVAEGRYSPVCYRDLSDIYYDVGYNENDPSFYKKSIAASREYLARTPDYDWTRAAVEHSISYLEGQLSKKP
jgi:tetratricopeptide (TPR) repeat protein